MSNLHAAGLPQLNIIDIPVAHLVAGQTIRYHRTEWIVIEVLPAHGLQSWAVVAISETGDREVLLYSNPAATAEVIAL